MTSLRRVLTYAVLVVLSVAAVSAVASASTNARAPTTVKPVIGKPTTVPAKAIPGKRFAVSFKVTRSDNGMPLTAGTMICDPSSAGKVIAHQESFTAGTARLSFVVPTTARQVRVKVTIKAGAQSATKIANFAVAQLAKPAISIGDVSVAEGNSGTTALSFPVTLSAPSTQAVSVSFATTDGTAVAPGDYTAASGKLTFNAGEKTKTIVVNVVADTTVEQNETMTVTLSNPVNATIADATATGTITNDDVAAATPGHFAGTIGSAQSPIGFDIGADGRSLSNWTTGELDLSCDPRAYAHYPSLQHPGPFPVAQDGSFAVQLAGSTSSGQVYSIKFAGKITGTTGSGTLRADVSIPVNGSQYNCTSGDQPWTVNKV